MQGILGREQASLFVGGILMIFHLGLQVCITVMPVSHYIYHDNNLIIGSPLVLSCR